MIVDNEQPELDRRLRPLTDRPDCFICGKPIAVASRGLTTVSEVGMGIALHFHTDCALPMTMQESDGSPGTFVRTYMRAVMELVDGMHA